MIYTIKYDIDKATDAGVELHPFDWMNNNGIKVIDYNCDGAISCYHFDVKNLPEELPDFIKIMKY